MIDINRKEPAILYWDIETSLMNVYTFSLWPKYIPIEDVIEDWRILCICYAWGDEKPQRVVGTEKSILRKFSRVLNKADIIVYHNGDKFDMKRFRARLLAHKLPPTKPFTVGETVDTLKVAKKEFGFSSNKLDFIAHNLLDIGQKIRTDKKLWKDCTLGNKKALERMAIYCEQDVVVLRDVYKKIQPFITNHPNMGHYSEKPVCPNCGGGHLQKRGFHTTRVSKKQRYQCVSCNSWSTSKTAIGTSMEYR